MSLIPGPLGGGVGISAPKSLGGGGRYQEGSRFPAVGIPTPISTDI